MKRSAVRSLALCRRGAPLALLAALYACAEPAEERDAGPGWGPGTVTGEAGVIAGDGGAVPGLGGASGTSDSGAGLPGGGASGPGGNASGGASDGGRPGGGTQDAGGMAGGTDGGTTPGSDGGTSPGGGGCALRPNKDGWIANASNGAHVQGAVYTYASTGSTIVPLTSTTTPFSTGESGKLCIKGEAAKVLNMEFSKYFGAGIAFDLCQADPMSPMKYGICQCPLGKGLVGINFKLSGTTIPVELRVQVHEVGRDEST